MPPAHRHRPPRYVRGGGSGRFPDSGGCLTWIIGFVVLCMILGYLH